MLDHNEIWFVVDNADECSKGPSGGNWFFRRRRDHQLAAYCVIIVNLLCDVYKLNHTMKC